MILNEQPRNAIAVIEGKESMPPPVWKTWFTQVYTAVAAWIGFSYFVQTANKTVANTVTETTLFGTGQGLLVLPRKLLQPGKRVNIKAEGVFSTTGTPTINFKVKAGSTLMESGAVTTATVTNKLWQLEADFVCRTFGPTGTVIGQGFVALNNSGATTQLTHFAMVMTAAATVDTTDEITLDLTVTWGAADPANTITCTNAEIEVNG